MNATRLHVEIIPRYRCSVPDTSVRLQRGAVSQHERGAAQESGTGRDLVNGPGKPTKLLSTLRANFRPLSTLWVVIIARGQPDRVKPVRKTRNVDFGETLRAGERSKIPDWVCMYCFVGSTKIKGRNHLAKFKRRSTISWERSKNDLFGAMVRTFDEKEYCNDVNSKIGILFRN